MGFKISIEIKFPVSTFPFIYISKFAGFLLALLVLIIILFLYWKLKLYKTYTLVKFNDSQPIEQQFSLPPTIMRYIEANPSSPKLYQKLIKSCKHFFYQKPILPIGTLEYDGEKNKWYASAINKSSADKKNVYKISLNNLKCKLWLNDKLTVKSLTQNDRVSILIPKLYKCNAKYLDFGHQIISNNEMKFLTAEGTVANMDLYCTIIANEDGHVIPHVMLKDIFFKNNVFIRTTD